MMPAAFLFRKTTGKDYRLHVGVSKPEQLVWLRYFCVEYDSIKAHYKVRLSEAQFKKLNPSLSAKWKKILHQITIDEK